MTKVFLPVVALTALLAGPTASIASEPGSAYGKTEGTLSLVPRGVATTPDEVRRQGGFATAGAVHWTKAPVSARKAS